MTNYNEKYAKITAQLSAALSAKAPTFTYEGAAYNITDRTARIRLIDRISNDYFAEHAEFNQRALDAWAQKGGKGERPRTVSVDTAMLERLADALLNEELTDTWRGKSTCVEYPFLSERQLTTRRNGEIGLKSAEETSTDGRNYAVPTRRRRNAYENNTVDTRTKSRNKARAAQYRKDTAPGALVTYNLHDTGGELATEFVTCQSVGERWRGELSLVC